MKITILGGTAQSTPALWAYLAGEANLSGLNVTLAGRNAERLNAVMRACTTLAPSNRNSIETAPLEEVAPADVFLIQVRSGGYPARSIDESFPHRFGICGDEGIGPGGLAAGIRNWQVIQPLLERIRVCAPRAMVLMMSCGIL